MRSGWRLAEGLLLAACVAVGCGKGSATGSYEPSLDGGNGGGGGGGTDGGSTVDGGTDGGSTVDGGTDGGTTADGGTDGGTTLIIPTLDGWTFYSSKDGLASNQVWGASVDEGGNLWVAGGTAGVFVQRAGSGTFQQFGLADGLHPYGYMADGGPADTHPYLNAISVSGGPAGTAFIGYRGRLDESDGVPKGTPGCESNWDINWDHVGADPTIYKSGDADKVTLTGNGIGVVHYDIFSGPSVVSHEMSGREKLCTIYRVLYQHGSNFVWFGGNHGFALGYADFAGNPTCNGQLTCAGVWEHVHPAIADTLGHTVTDEYRGIAIDPLAQVGGFHDVWFGGLVRTTRFRFGQTGGDYWNAEDMTEFSPSPPQNIRNYQRALDAWHNRIDVWPDPVGEYDSNYDPKYPTPAQWQSAADAVSGIAADPSDNSVWVASSANGLRHLDHDGNFLGDVTSLTAKNVSAIARGTDPDGSSSIWVGYRWGGGISRLKGGTVRHYDWSVLGTLANSAVFDIQIAPATATSPRRVVVSFQDGVVGVFSGN